MKFKVLKILLVGLSLSLFAGLLLLIFEPHILPITSVHLEGYLINTNPQVLQATLSEKVRNGFFNIDQDAVRSAVLSLPWIKAVQIQRQWPDTLILKIQERQAIARWQDQALIDQEGDLFMIPISNVTDIQLPILSGPANSVDKVFKHYQLLSSLVQADGLRIEELSLSARLAWQMSLDNGIKLMLGRGDSEARLQRFLKIYPRLAGTFQSLPMFIDLRYTNGIAVPIVLAK